MVPCCRYCVAEPDGRQDLKLKSCRSGTMTLAELAHEVVQLPIGQRRMIADLANLRRGREQVIEMPLPACWVFALKLNSPFALAASITCSMRLRMRLAVSVLLAQIGSMIRRTSASVAFSRASSRFTSRSEPRPCPRARPCSLYRKSQLFCAALG